MLRTIYLDRFPAWTRQRREPAWRWAGRLHPSRAPGTSPRPPRPADRCCIIFVIQYFVENLCGSCRYWIANSHLGISRYKRKFIKWISLPLLSDYIYFYVITRDDFFTWSWNKFVLENAIEIPVYIYLYQCIYYIYLEVKSGQGEEQFEGKAQDEQ